jgi:GNAT superfamily N-acetyltransferase
VESWGSPYLAAQAAWLAHLGTAPGAEVLESEGLYAVRTRVTSNSENGVLSGAAAEVSRATAERLAAWFAEWSVPSSWLCAEGEGRVETAAVLEAAGYRPERSAWDMRARVASVALGSGEAPAGVRIADVSSARAFEAWLDVAGACDWFESEPGRRALRDLHSGLGLDDSAPLRHYVAMREETAVGMASAFFTGKTVVLASVAVLPSERRLGIGRALAFERLRQARDRGCDLAVLAPSPDGAALYEALGFETYRQAPDRWFYAPLKPGDSAVDVP